MPPPSREGNRTRKCLEANHYRAYVRDSQSHNYDADVVKNALEKIHDQSTSNPCCSKIPIAPLMRERQMSRRAERILRPNLQTSAESLNHRGRRLREVF